MVGLHDPVLRNESYEFILQRVEDRVPRNGTKTLNESALMIREVSKNQPPIELSQLPSILKTRLATTPVAPRQ